MSKEHKRYKKIQEYEPSDRAICCAVVDLFAILLLATSFILDYFYHDVINDGLITLSVDSLLTIITIAVSLYVPINDNRTLKDYYISVDDYKKVRKAPNSTYINLIVVATLLFIINVFLYVFQFNLSLIVTVFISVIYIAIFIVPGIYQNLKGEDHLTKLVCKEFEKYRHNDSKWFTKLRRHISVKPEITSLNKLIEGILIKKGYEKTLFLFTSGMDTSSLEYQNIVLYLIDLSEQLTSNMCQGEFEYPITDNIVKSCIDNVSECLFKSTDISSFDDALISEITFYVCKSLSEINQIIDANDQFINLSIPLRSLLKELINKSDLDAFYLSILYSLLIYSIGNESEWFIDDIAHLAENKNRREKHRPYFYFVCTFFLINIVSDQDLNLSINKEIEALLSRYFSKVVKDQTKEIANGYDERLDKFYDISFSKCLHIIRNIFNTLEMSVEIYSHLFHYLTQSISDTPTLLLTIAYQASYGTLDDWLYSFSSKTNDSINHFMRFSKRRIPYFDALRNYGIYPKSFDDEAINNLLEYIKDYSSRVEQLEKVSEDIGFSQFKENFDSYLNEKKWYSKNLIENSEYTTTRQLSSSINFYLDKNAKLIRDDNSLSINLDEILFEAYRKGLHYNMFLVNEADSYTEEICNRIINFDPSYMNAPRLCSYLNNHPSKASKSLLKIPQTKLAPGYGYNYEIFYQNDAFKVFIQPDYDKIRIKNVTEDEARYAIRWRTTLSFYENISEENIKEYQESHVVLLVPFTFRIIFNKDKFLVYYMDHSQEGDIDM